MKSISKKGVVTLVDTTLRDGEQAPGVVFTPEQKIELAQHFDDFGIDVIDIMPAVSKQEKELTKQLVKMGLSAAISATTRSKKEDVDLALDCGVSRVFLLSPLSDLHLEHKLRISREENLNKALEIIDYAQSHGLGVDFAGEDATRADPTYLLHFINSVSSQIDTFFVADTLGCLTPPETYALFPM